MTSSQADLVEVALRHSTAEAGFDLAGTLATLESDPVYELFPVALRMEGMDLARRYYEHYFAEVAPRIVSFRLIGRWVNEQGLNEEYGIVYKPDGEEPRPYRILGILTFGENLLSGERIYADTELLKIMFAPIWNELKPTAP
jgi:hypothetical protein